LEVSVLKEIKVVVLNVASFRQTADAIVIAGIASNATRRIFQKHAVCVKRAPSPSTNGLNNGRAKRTSRRTIGMWHMLLASAIGEGGV
jgi:hypothetical protein